MPVYAEQLPNEVWTRLFKSMFERWLTPDRSIYRPPHVSRNEVVCTRWRRYRSSNWTAPVEGKEEEDEEAELDRALWACARVSRRFNAIANPILYENVFIYMAFTRSSWSTLLRFRRVILDDATRSDSRSLGKMVRYLDFGFEDHEGMPEDSQSMVMIGTLLAQLSNLKDWGHFLDFPPLLDTLAVLSSTLHLTNLFLSLDNSNYLSCFTVIAHLSPPLRVLNLNQASGSLQQCDDDQTPSPLDLRTPISFPHLHTIELHLYGYTNLTLLDRIAFWRAPSLRKASFSFKSRKGEDQLDERVFKGPLFFLARHGSLFVEAEIKLSSIPFIGPLLNFVNLLHLETSPFDVDSEETKTDVLFALKKLRTLVIFEVGEAELVDSFFELAEELPGLKDVVWRDRTWGTPPGWDGRRIIPWGQWLKKKGVEFSWTRD